MDDLNELKKQGLSIQAISGLTGFDPKTVRKYLAGTEPVPIYGPRSEQASKLDGFKPYLETRLQAGVWNARVLLRELRGRNYSGGYTILTDWLRPQREAARTVAERRFETLPGQQAQVDWGHLGWLETSEDERQLWGFAFTLGYSRMMFAEAALDQKLGTLLRMHEEAFRRLGVPQEILYDRMKTVWLETDDRGEIIWNPVFLDFAGYWGFKPRLCRPYRAKTKGKIESGVKYVRRNFLCGLQGREPAGLSELNAELRQWLATVANVRIHGTTGEQVCLRWEEEKPELRTVDGRVAYPYADDELRKVSRDCYVSWQSSRYSVPWTYAGKPVWVRENGSNVEVRYGAQQIARHERAMRRHQVVTQPVHHQGIPDGSEKRSAKILVHLRETAPDVEIRPLAAYESIASGGVQ